MPSLKIVGRKRGNPRLPLSTATVYLSLLLVSLQRAFSFNWSSNSEKARLLSYSSRPNLHQELLPASIWRKHLRKARRSYPPHWWRFKRPTICFSMLQIRVWRKWQVTLNRSCVAQTNLLLHKVTYLSIRGAGSDHNPGSCLGVEEQKSSVHPDA